MTTTCLSQDDLPTVRHHRHQHTLHPALETGRRKRQVSGCVNDSTLLPELNINHDPRRTKLRQIDYAGIVLGAGATVLLLVSRKTFVNISLGLTVSRHRSPSLEAAVLSLGTARL